MTEKNFNYTLRYYLFQMGRLKTMTVFSCLFAVLGFPLLTVARRLSSFSSFYDEISVPMMVISVICVGGTALLSFITPIVAFKHLYTKTTADNILSLPLTTTQRFIGDIGAILTSYSLPLGVSIGLSVIAHSVVTSVMDMKTTDYQIVNIAMMAFFATLQFIFLNSAIIACCGRLIEAILYPIAVNIAMPVAITYGGEIAFSNAFGIYYSGTLEIVQSPVFNMWPLGYLMNMQSWSVYLSTSIISSIIYLGLTYLAYRKRHAQNIGKPFVFKYSYLVATVVIGIAFIICYVWLADMSYLPETYFPRAGTIIASVVILLILMLIMEIINYKKIHSIPKFIFHYAGTLGGGFLIYFMLIFSKGFGAGYYVPDTNQVNYACLSTSYSEEGWENRVYNKINAASEEALNIILEEHQYIVDNAEKGNTGHYINLTSNASYSLDYRMKNGTQASRNYDMDEGNTDIWEKLFKTEDYRMMPVFYIDGYDYWLEEPAQVRLINRHSRQVYVDYLQYDLLESELRDAIEKDLKADTEYGRHDENTVGVLLLGRANFESEGKYILHTDYFYGTVQIAIYESYVNTINILKQYGTVPTAEQATEDSVKNTKILMLYRMKSGGIDMAAEQIMGADADSSAIFITEEEFKELTSKQVKYNIYDGEDTSDDYTYYLVRGAWYHLDRINHKDMMIEALEKDGFVLADYDFFDDYDGKYFGYDHVYSMINTEYNSYCNALFENRTQLVNALNPETGIYEIMLK